VLAKVGKSRHQGIYRCADKSLARPGRKQTREHVRISTTSRRELLSSFFFVQGKAPKEIHAIPTETLPCFLPRRAKDLSAPIVNHSVKTKCLSLQTNKDICPG